jgi:hypothetical protein
VIGPKLHRVSVTAGRLVARSFDNGMGQPGQAPVSLRAKSYRQRFSRDQIAAGRMRVFTQNSGVARKLIARG